MTDICKVETNRNMSSLSSMTFEGTEAYRLKIEFLEVIVIPDHGGKAVSIKYLPADFELLFQNPYGIFRQAKRGDSFSDYEACGADDAFPTIDACCVKVGDRYVEYPDHGEIWSARFKTESHDNGLTLSWISPTLGYRYLKKYKVEKNSLKLQYQIENPGDIDIPAIWTLHCLVNVEPDMRIILPKGEGIFENVFACEKLGNAGRKFHCPEKDNNGNEIDLFRIPDHGMYKFYIVDRVSEGRCGYEYVHSGVKVTYRYLKDILPYLGFWVTAGGYRGDVNCALEPSNGYYDNIPLAMKNDKCPVLHAGETWKIEISITLDSLIGDNS